MSDLPTGPLNVETLKDVTLPTAPVTETVVEWVSPDITVVQVTEHGVTTEHKVNPDGYLVVTGSRMTHNTTEYKTGTVQIVLKPDPNG